MNRGNIPGFYWDDEKKKYFKIQANHLVPQAAKYAKGNVKQEKRLAKKRKTEEQKRHRRETQVIKAARVLKSSAIGGIGLEREHGLLSKSKQTSMQRDRALVSQWACERIEIKLPDSSNETRVQDAHYDPRSKRMAIASTHALSGIGVLHSRSWDWAECSGEGSATLSGRGIAAFNSNVSSISTTHRGEDQYILACAEYCLAGAIYIGFLSDPSDQPGEENARPGVYLTVGPPGTSLFDTAANTSPASTSAAVIGSTGIYVLDMQAAAVYSRLAASDPFDWPGCAACVNWLDPNTVLYGAKDHNYSVMLWDTRTENGKTARFAVRDRLTGIFNASKSGSDSHDATMNPHEILASTNHHIHLFDTRMPRPSAQTKQESPILSLPHVHGGPRFQSTARGSLVAAVDRDNVVQVYSTRSGSKVASLTTPPWQHRRFESPTLRKLMWYDDVERGETLQAVQGNGILRWCWGGPGMDDDEDED